MTNIIMTLTRLSFLTSIMALIVLGIRFCLRKAPKTYTYILWIFVFIRAIMPASYTSDYSLWNLMQSFFSTHQTTAPATNAETLKAISKPFAFPRDAAAAVSQTSGLHNAKPVQPMDHNSGGLGAWNVRYADLQPVFHAKTP